MSLLTASWSFYIFIFFLFACQCFSFSVKISRNMWIYRCWKNSFIKLGFTYHNIHQFHVDNPTIFSKDRVVYPSRYIYFSFFKNFYHLFIFDCTGSSLLLVAFSICPECCHSFSGCRAWDSAVAPQNNIYISCKNTVPSFSFKIDQKHFPMSLYTTSGFPGGASCKELSCQCKRGRFDLWVGKIPWRRVWQPTPLFLPGEPYGQRRLGGCSP